MRTAGKGGGRIAVLGVGLIVLTALVPIVGLALLLRGGGGDDDNAAVSAADVRAAQDMATFALFWAGESVAGFPLTGVLRKGGQVSVVYGSCTPPGGDSGCPYPVEIQTTSICERNSLIVDIRPRASRVVRGAIAHDYGDGDLSLETGASNVTLFSRPELRDRVLAALAPVRSGAPGIGAAEAGDLPAPRYPLAYVLSLRLVRDAYRRLGDVRAVRDEVGISKSAVRQRLAFARQLGGQRLRRPAAQFVREGGCTLEPAG